MTFLLVLGGVAGAVASVALITVGIWACTGESVEQRCFSGEGIFSLHFYQVSVCLRRSWLRRDLHTNAF